MATVYIITNTDGSVSFAIPPGATNGPGNSQQESDLLLYGQGTYGWGQGYTENFYKLTENFACPEKAGSPGTPQDEGDLGAGRGVNNPVTGQLWFNTTTSKMYVYDGSAWNLAERISSGASAPSNPVEGDLWYDTNIPQLKIHNGGSFVSVAERYLELAGGTMSGNVDMDGNEVIGLPAVPSATAAASREYVDDQINTVDNGIVPIGGIIMYSGTIGSIPSNYTLCDGLNGRPDLRGRFIVGAGGAYNVGDSGGSETHSHTITVDAGGGHSHTGSVTINSAGSHTHSITVGSTTLSESQMPSHKHEEGTVHRTSANSNINVTGKFGVADSSHAEYTGDVYDTEFIVGQTFDTSTEGNDTSHTHSGSASSDGSHSHSGSVTIDAVADHVHTASSSTESNLPPYYALAFIMRIS